MRSLMTNSEQLEERKEEISYDLSWTFSATSSTGDPRKAHHTKSRLNTVFGGIVVLVSRVPGIQYRICP